MHVTESCRFMLSPTTPMAKSRHISVGHGRNKIQVAADYNHSMDHHTVAAISISGTCLDVLVSLYLAYDLLGGPHGPLRLITRAVTYSIVFGIGYGIGLGLFFGLVAGAVT